MIDEHGVQIVDQRLHGLVGGLVGLAQSVLICEGCALLIELTFDADGCQLTLFDFLIGFAHVDLGINAHLLGDALDQSADLGLTSLGIVISILQQGNGLAEVGTVDTAEGLGYALGQAVVEVGNALTAMLVVLVGLNGDTGQRTVAGDIVGLTQETVACGEAALEEGDDIDLAAGGGQCIEVKVMNMNVTLAVCAALLGRQDVLFVKVLGAFAAVLEHGTHGSVAVNIGVVTLEIAVLGIREGDLVVDTHQIALHLACLVALGTVDDILLGYGGITVVHQNQLNDILNVLYAGCFFAKALDQLILNQLGHLHALAVVNALAGLHGLGNSTCDLGEIVVYLSAVSFNNLGEQFHLPLSIGALGFKSI